MSDAPHPEPPPAPEHWALRRLRQFWLIVPLVGILVVLMLWDLGDVMDGSPFSSDPCALSEIDQSSMSARMYLPIARWALRYTPSPSVAIVYIDPSQDPPDLLTNTCASRAFLARLITDLNALSAHVIVIDKYYSANACAEQDKNGAFIAAMESSKIPIVVGQATQALPESSGAAGCLAPTPRLEFSKTSKVLYGVTRINNDDLKIPLRWPLFTEPKPKTSTTPASASTPLPPEAGDSLALVAAKVVSPRIESHPSVRRLLASQKHPYTTFLNLPHVNGLTVLCSAEASPRAPIDGQPGDELCKSWVRPVDNLNGDQLSFAGKIVVIGDLFDLDMKPFPNTLAPFPPKQRPAFSCRRTTSRRCWTIASCSRSQPR